MEKYKSIFKEAQNFKYYITTDSSQVVSNRIIEIADRLNEPVYSKCEINKKLSVYATNNKKFYDLIIKVLTNLNWTAYNSKSNEIKFFNNSKNKTTYNEPY